MPLVLSPESRRAFFRGRVISEQCGHREVTSGSILAGLFISPEVIAVCKRLRVNVPRLINDLGLGEAIDSLRLAEKALVERGIAFGSREHLDLVGEKAPTPFLSAEARQIVSQLEEECGYPNDSITVLQVLCAFISNVAQFGEKASIHGLTAANVRTYSANLQG